MPRLVSGRVLRWLEIALVAGLIGLLPAREASAIRLSETTLTISNQDPNAPAAGTFQIFGVVDELPPGAQTVAGGAAPGDVILLVRATLTAGEVFSLGGLVTGTGPPQPGGGNFCCVHGSGYLPASERIPGPDAFFPFLWEWFFDDVADPGLWLPGETVEFWVSFSQLESGDEISFFAIGTGPCGPGCPDPFGTVTVLPDAVPLLGAGARGLLVLLLIAVASWSRPGGPSPGPRSGRVRPRTRAGVARRQWTCG